MEQETEIERSFTLPLQICRGSPARVICRASVVQTVPCVSAGTQPALGARITLYRFLSPSEQPEAAMSRSRPSIAWSAGHDPLGPSRRDAVS
jgi:hypothetical protein